MRSSLGLVTFAVLVVAGCTQQRVCTTCDSTAPSRTDSVCPKCEPRPAKTATAPAAVPAVPAALPALPAALPAPMPYAIERLTPATPSVPVASPPEAQRTLPDSVPSPKVSDPPPPAPPAPVQQTAHDAGAVKIGAPIATMELIGAVHAWRKTWRLCYAAPDCEDPNGGRVTLVGDPGIERLTEGKIVRARGFLIPAANRNEAPQFHVESLDVFE